MFVIKFGVYHIPLSQPIVEYLRKYLAKIKIFPGYVQGTRRSNLMQKTNTQKSCGTVP